MTEIIISKSKNINKKYDARIDGKKTVSFGSSQHQSFPDHKNPERKQRYLNRHKSRENWNDHTTAGFFAKNILWNKPTITASITDTNNRFKNINIKLK